MPENLFKSPSSIFSSSFSSPSTVQIFPVPGLESRLFNLYSLVVSIIKIIIIHRHNNKWFSPANLLFDITPVPGRLIVPWTSNILKSRQKISQSDKIWSERKKEVLYPEGRGHSIWIFKVSHRPKIISRPRPVRTLKNTEQANNALSKGLCFRFALTMVKSTCHWVVVTWLPHPSRCIGGPPCLTQVTVPQCCPRR